MNELPAGKNGSIQSAEAPPPGRGSRPARSSASGVDARAWKHFACAALGLGLLFVAPLWQLAKFAAGSELYSYILLIPFISGYLIWQNRRPAPAAGAPARAPGAAFLAAGALVVAGYRLGLLPPRMRLAEADYLALMMIAFLFCLCGVCAWFLGMAFMRKHGFALSFLIFLVPVPTAVVRVTETFLQHGSAVVAQMLFAITGTPLLQDGLVFQLPGINLQIAPECSGIHSSLVLFITSLLAGYYFLRSPWKRALFIGSILPLALLRNGFRVYILGELCVHIGPQMIDTPIHHRGGPLFFALSLVPLFALLLFLRRAERVEHRSASVPR